MPVMPDRFWLGRVIFTASAILAVSALLWLASGYPPRARYIPEVVAIFALACLSLQLIIEVVSALRYREGRLQVAEGLPADEAEAADHDGRLRLELIAYFWLALLLLSLFLFGFLVSIPVYTLLYLRFQAGISWFRAALYGFGAWAFSYFLFVRLFEIPLYQGLVFSSFVDF